MRRRFHLWLAAAVLIIGGGFIEVEWARLLGFLLLAASVAAILIRGRINEWPGMSRSEAWSVCAVVAVAGLAGLVTGSSLMVVALANAIVGVGLVWYVAARLLLRLRRLTDG